MVPQRLKENKFNHLADTDINVFLLNFVRQPIGGIFGFKLLPCAC